MKSPNRHFPVQLERIGIKFPFSGPRICSGAFSGPLVKVLRSRVYKNHTKYSFEQTQGKNLQRPHLELQKH